MSAWTPSDTPGWIDEARRRWEEGEPVPEIAADLGVGLSTIHCYRSRDNWSMAARRRAKHEAKHPEAERARRLFESGALPGEITRSTGIPSSTWRGWAVTWGWDEQRRCRGLDLRRYPFPGHKMCAACGEILPYDRFWRKQDSRRGDGMQSRCKACHAKLPSRSTEYRRHRRGMASRQQDLRRRAAAARPRRARRVWRRIQNERAHDLAAAVSLGYGETGGERARRRFREKYLDDPSAERLRVKRYKHAHPERLAAQNRRRFKRMARRNDRTLNEEEVGLLYRRATACPYCGVPLTPGAATLDHMDPLSRGGLHGISNVITCCNPCNARKRDRPFAEWLRELDEPYRSRALGLYRRTHGHGPDEPELDLRWDS